jgi:photosystem II stability/assembly factor-like uncharacterized protein
MYKLWAAVFMLTYVLVGQARSQNHWRVINQSNRGCQTICFTTPDIGWSTQVFSAPPPNDFGLYQTTDGGITWNGVPRFQGVFVPYESFFNERRGLVTATLWQAVTTDGGTTWMTADLPETTLVTKASYLDSTTLIGISSVFVNEDSMAREINRSTDGGLTWRNLYNDRSPVYLGEKPAVAPNGTILISGTLRQIWRSTDSGNNWQVIDASPWLAGTIVPADSGVFFQGTRTLGSSRSEICRSLDDGITWQSVWIDTTGDGRYLGPEVMAFTDRRHGWVGWDHGLMTQTSDGGETWEAYSLPGSVEGVFDMSFLDSTLGWAIDPGVGSPTLVYRWSTADSTDSRRQNLAYASNLRVVSIYPNPFNSEATIAISVPTTEHVTATVYDLLGHPLDVLTDRLLVGGIYQLNWKGSHYASGIYFLRISGQGTTVTSKLQLIK